ncbi:serine hydrolase domain-containing protein [Pseudalkalibacillus decolorationis]|uniref:serine hydrolase domain-containing protein n=1 Tax=Pseudalkalibacillus decolorationis TaxID=163879 RepID=UPI00214907C9|nr:serine hydrolase domain-containing protein [Pseudalkalibacillus decolorationis]
MESKYEKLIKWIEDIKVRNHSSAAALLILKDNKVVLEHYSGQHSNTEGAIPITANSRFNVASSRKSYLGLAIAYALYEGKIGSLDDLATQYFHDYDDELLAQTTIRHLVTHSHGLDEDENGMVYREFEPGEGWAYRGINVKMMTQLVEKLYNKSFPQLLKERVFAPLNFTRTAWETVEHENLVKVIVNPNKEGEYKLGSTNNGMESNLYVTTKEFGYWGNLHLNKGYINGKQVVPREVIELATQVHSPPLIDQQLPRNGLFWFVQDIPRDKSELGNRVPKGSYQILGVTGPTLLVIPEHNIVVAKMYNKRYNYGNDNYLYYLKEFSNLVADTFE